MHNGHFKIKKIQIKFTIILATLSVKEMTA